MLIAIIGFIWTVNPYGYHKVKGQELYDLKNYARHVKPKWFFQSDYNTVLIGSSRIQNGFDLTIIEEAKKEKAFNLGLSGLRYFEVLGLIEYVFQQTNVDEKLEIIVGADAYLMPFNSKKAK